MMLFTNINNLILMISVIINSLMYLKIYQNFSDQLDTIEERSDEFTPRLEIVNHGRDFKRTSYADSLDYSLNTNEHAQIPEVRSKPVALSKLIFLQTKYQSLKNKLELKKLEISAAEAENKQLELTIHELKSDIAVKNKEKNISRQKLCFLS
jgi:hypothetical protein